MALLVGTQGSETLAGGDAADTLRGGGGADLLQGGGGDDVLIDLDGFDTLLGGGGDDVLVGDGRGGRAEGGDGIDRITGFASGQVFGGGGTDLIEAGPNSTITGGEGQDRISLPSMVSAADLPITVTDFAAGAAGDRLDFSALLAGPGIAGYDGTNPFGTAGYLRLRQDGADTLVELDADGGANGFLLLLRLQGVAATALVMGNLGFDPGGATEPGRLLAGGIGDDALRGGAGRDTITGSDGNDSLDGEGGADSLSGGAGADTLFGGRGSDTLLGGAGNDALYGEEGHDRLEGGEGDDYLVVTEGADTVLGGAGNDTVQGGFLIDGGEGNDSISGPALARIAGGAGDDTISAFAGSSLTGGTGRDSFGPRYSDFNAGDPILVLDFASGAAGDRLDFSLLLGAGGGARGYTGGNPFASGHLRFWQNGADTQFDFDRDGGGDGFVALLRLTGVDALSLGPGSLGWDPGAPEGVIAVSRDGIALSEVTSRYSGPVAYLRHQFLGRSSGEAARGTAENDFMNLLGGDDAADGMAGDDVLDGGTGSNFLTGGAGWDVFFLDGRSGTTTWSTITDWQAGEQLSVWGWRPGVSRASWVESAGAEGYTGITLHADLDANGVIDTSVTWSGLTLAQLPVPGIFDGLLWFQ